MAHHMIKEQSCFQVGLTGPWKFCNNSNIMLFEKENVVWMVDTIDLLLPLEIIFFFFSRKENVSPYRFILASNYSCNVHSVDLWTHFFIYVQHSVHSTIFLPHTCSYMCAIVWPTCLCTVASIHVLCGWCILLSLSLYVCVFMHECFPSWFIVSYAKKHHDHLHTIELYFCMSLSINYQIVV